MLIKKESAGGVPSFNDYSLQQISWGQLKAIKDALEKDHSDPISDEIFAEIQYYLQNVPGPGVDPDQWKAERDADKDAKKEANKSKDDGSGVPDAPETDTDLEARHRGEPESTSEEDAPQGEESFQAGPELSDEERSVLDQYTPGERPTGITHDEVPEPPTE